MTKQEELNNPDENQETDQQREVSKKLKEIAENEAKNVENERETPPQKPARLIDRVLGIEKHRKRQEAVANEIKELREKEKADWTRQQENLKTEKEIQQREAELRKVHLRTPEEIALDPDHPSNRRWEVTRKGYMDLGKNIKNMQEEKWPSQTIEHKPADQKMLKIMERFGKRIERTAKIEEERFGTYENFRETLQSAQKKQESDDIDSLTEREQLALDLQAKYQKILKERGEALRDLEAKKSKVARKKIKKI